MEKDKEASLLKTVAAVPVSVPDTVCIYQTSSAFSVLRGWQRFSLPSLSVQAAH